MTAYQHSKFNEISLLPNSSLKPLEEILSVIDTTPIIRHLEQRRARRTRRLAGAGDAESAACAHLAAARFNRIVSPRSVEKSIPDDRHRLSAAKRRIVRVPIDPDNLRTFGSLPVSTRKWQKHYHRRNAIERVNARVGRDFKMEHHCIRGKASMQLHITLQMTVMPAIASHAIDRGKPHQIRSLLHSLAA